MAHKTARILNHGTKIMAQCSAMLVTQIATGSEYREYLIIFPAHIVSLYATIVCSRITVRHRSETIDMPDYWSLLDSDNSSCLKTH